ncbi:aspartate kinase [Haloactinomyces albus]|uniref:Aspartokinase n=1 Tax=Haloactinomyces albus TaxID=1352928 RepID=A0AAE3ZFA5_9ACTN|nr:aspartate kinase [Haloactinomyces albus]MDR7301964.1 aspartate kinase [Haloactinomyces albus]
MEIVVQKYGGSSLATLDKVRRIAEGVAERHRRSGPLVVVVSARGKTTDELLRLARETGGGAAGRETDQLLATGEAASAALMAMALGALRIPATSLTGEQAAITTNGPHGAGSVRQIDTDRISGLLKEGQTVVVAGFHGINDGGDVVTLGRGGSDTSAVALAAALQAHCCEIYTDVAGVHTCDPRIVPTARVLPEIEMGVMAEMAFTGANVLHPRSVELAGAHNVTLRVRDSFSDHPGTTILKGTESEMLESDDAVTAVTHDLDVARVLIHADNTAVRNSPGVDFATNLLSVLAEHGTAADLIARSGPNEDEFRMGFTMRSSEYPDIEESLRSAVTRMGGVVRIDDNVAKVSLVGLGLLSRPQGTARMLAALSAAGINPSWVSNSQLRTSVIIPLSRVVQALELLHDEFGLDQEPEPNTLAVA